MAICAYCNQDRRATREHVIPAFMYALQKEVEGTIVGWNEVAQRMVGGEGKVKDVCEDCNSNILSALDAYGKTVLEEAGLLVSNFVRTSASLRYEYDLLLRWLLKISFNSSRTDGVHSSLFADHIPFMLGTSPAPKGNEVRCFAYLAAPEIRGQSRLGEGAFSKLSGASKRLNPFLVRISYGLFQEDLYTLRVVVLGAIVFYLILFREGVLPGHAASTLRGLLNRVPGSVELSPRLRSLELNAGMQTWLDLYEPQVARVQAIDRQRLRP